MHQGEQTKRVETVQGQQQTCADMGRVSGDIHSSKERAEPQDRVVESPLAIPHL